MPDTALTTVSHFMRGTLLRDALVAEITGVGVLRFGQFSQDALLVFGRLFDPLIELIPGTVLHVLLSAGSKKSFFMPGLPRRRSGCLKHGTYRFFGFAG